VNEQYRTAGWVTGLDHLNAGAVAAYNVVTFHRDLRLPKSRDLDIGVLNNMPFCPGKRRKI